MKTEGLLYALLFVFIVTFTVFPGVTDHSYLNFILPLNNDVGWFNLFMTTVFNVMDTVGRKMGGLKQFDLKGPTIKILSIARILFIVTFLLVAFEVGPAWLFNSTWFKIVDMSAFAFTNGYVSTLCAVKAPGTVSIEQRGQVGAFIGTTITLGILMGSILAIFMGFAMAAAPAPLSLIHI